MFTCLADRGEFFPRFVQLQIPRPLWHCGFKVAPSALLVSTMLDGKRSTQPLQQQSHGYENWRKATIVPVLQTSLVALVIRSNRDDWCEMKYFVIKYMYKKACLETNRYAGTDTRLLTSNFHLSPRRRRHESSSTIIIQLEKRAKKGPATQKSSYHEAPLHFAAEHSYASFGGGG